MTPVPSGELSSATMTVSRGNYSTFETDAYVEQFLDGVHDRGLRFTFRRDMRLSTARRLHHRLPDLYTAGLRAVYVGIEKLVGHQRTSYGKCHPGKAVINLLRPQGIFVAVGFITLDPMHTPGEFRLQVLGIIGELNPDGYTYPYCRHGQRQYPYRCRSGPTRAETFSATRVVIFRRTAQDYEQLFSRGIRHYRSDLIKFINHWRSVPSFGSDVL